MKTARAGDEAEVDARTTSLLVVAILAFRVLFTATPFPVLLQQDGAATTPALLLGMTSIALSVAMIAGVARGMNLATRRFAPLLVVDFVLSCAVGLSAAGLPDATRTSLHAVLWFPFHGTVMLWTVLLGAAWGYASVAIGVGMFVTLYAVERLPRPGEIPFVLNHAVWLTLPLLIAVVTSVLLRMIVRTVLAHGVLVGRSDEQVRMTRTLHDTVLQTLDSMAMRREHDEDGPDRADRGSAHERLAELRAAAARQAVELRQLLQIGTGVGVSSTAAMLAAFVREFAGMGLRVELVVDDLDGREPEPAVRNALGAAAREALTNVVKHAGVRTAIVRAALTPDGVEVTVRDHGRGFDPRHRTPGFGIDQSIVARMREAGGDAIVWSRPDRGARIRLVAPA